MSEDNKSLEESILEGLGKIGKAFVRGAGAKKRPAPSSLNGTNPAPAVKPGCGGCGGKK